jgi:hypothetical protein
MMPDGMISCVPLYDKLLEAGLPILLYVGNMDRKDGPVGVQEWMKKMTWTHIDAFHASSENVYYYESDDNKEIRVGGNFKQHKNLMLLMVYSAGHMVPSTQLATSRSFLKDFVNDQQLKCHATDDIKCKLDDVACRYMNNCSGNGECVNGKCLSCKTGFYGADCSVKPRPFVSDSNVQLGPQGWYHFSIKNGEDYEIEIYNDEVLLQVYAQEGTLPSRSDHQLYYQGKRVKFLLKGTESTNVISVYNPHTSQNATLILNSEISNTSTVWLAGTLGQYKATSLLWIAVLLGLVVLVLTVINVRYFIYKKKKGVQYVGVNDSAEVSNILQ